MYCHGVFVLKVIQLKYPEQWHFEKKYQKKVAFHPVVIYCATVVYIPKQFAFVCEAAVK